MCTNMNRVKTTWVFLCYVLYTKGKFADNDAGSILMIIMFIFRRLIKPFPRIICLWNCDSKRIGSAQTIVTFCYQLMEISKIRKEINKKHILITIHNNDYLIRNTSLSLLFNWHFHGDQTVELPTQKLRNIH